MCRDGLALFFARLCRPFSVPPACAESVLPERASSPPRIRWAGGEPAPFSSLCPAGRKSAPPGWGRPPPGRGAGAGGGVRLGLGLRRGLRAGVFRGGSQGLRLQGLPLAAQLTGNAVGQRFSPSASGARSGSGAETGWGTGVGAGLGREMVAGEYLALVGEGGRQSLIIVGFPARLVLGVDPAPARCCCQRTAPQTGTGAGLLALLLLGDGLGEHLLVDGLVVGADVAHVLRVHGNEGHRPEVQLGGVLAVVWHSSRKQFSLVRSTG